MKAIAPAGALLLLLGACTGTARPEAAAARPIPFPAGAALGSVMGRDANQLTALFGTANADLREGPGRKLQYASAICVLDAYLYPRTQGAAAVVTHVDARQPDGSPIDEGSCVAAIQRRSGGR